MTQDNRTQLIDLYESGPDRVEQLVASIPDPAMDYHAGPGRWSVRQIVIHIVDSDINSFLRLRKPLAEPGAAVPVYDQEKWASNLHGDSILTETALGLFRAYRAYNSQYLRAVVDGEWSLTVMHPENGVMSLEDVLHIYANHPLWHIDHINRTVDAWKRAEAGETVDPDVSFWVPPT